MKYFKFLFISFLALFVLGAAATTGIYFYIKPDLPSVDVLKDVRLQTPMKVYTQDGKLISQFGVKRRIPVTLDQVPPQLIHAILATEDSRFYEHPGVDPIGVLRAAVNLILTGRKGQGASTLTMQLARGFFLSRDKTYIRKIKEVFIAWHMEQLLTKDEILELYLNKVELGHRAFGFGAAAQVYYGKSLNELNLAQIATIAGLPQAPSILNPISRPERSKERRRVVLLRMLDEGYITKTEFNQAVAEPVTASKHGAEIELDAPYLADLIYHQMIDRYGKEEAETGGYQVYATVPSYYQAAAQQAVHQNLYDYDERHGYRGPIKQLWEPLTVDENADPDLATTTLNDPSWSEEQMLEAMHEVTVVSEVVPAVVTRVNENSVVVFNHLGEYQVIDWDGLDWARSWINDERQGPAPKVAADILRPGAMIWMRKNQQDIWQLSQLPEVSGAFIALNPNDGAAQAVIGGYSFYQSQFNRATQAKRQVGSNIKPFIYSAAIEQGYTLASIINDAPINQWDKHSGTAWRPENSPAIYDGPIRMRVALGKSKNVVSIRLLRAVGIDNAVEHLSKFGFEPNEIPRDETMALGSGSHTPLEVARAMAVIANGGYLIEPHFIDRIENEYGDEIWHSDAPVACMDCDAATENDASDDANAQLEAALAAEFGVHAEQANNADKRQAPRVISAQNAFLVSEMMRTAVRSNGNWKAKTYWMGTGWRARNILHRDDLHGKTGTTNDSRDTWFSGFTRNLVATTWVGFDEMNRALGKSEPNQNLINKDPDRYNWIGNAMIGGEDGAKAAEPAWIRFMQVALADTPEMPWPTPPGIITTRIDIETGKLTKRADYSSMFEYFIKGTEPQSYVQQDQVIDPFSSQSGDQPVTEDIF